LISIALPRENPVYFTDDGWLFGPFYSDNSPEGDPVTFNADIDNLTEGMRTYHEQNVGHFKASGGFTFQPHSSDIVASPVVGSLSQIAFKCRQGTSSTISTILSSHGLGYEGTFNHVSSKASVINGGGDSFEQLSVYKDSLSKPVTVRRTLYQIMSVTSDRINWRYMTMNRSIVLQNNGISDYSQINAGNLEELWSKGIPGRQSPWYNASSLVLKPATKAIFSPQHFRGWINTHAIPSLEEYPFDLEGISYGELAMKASEKVNRNQTNMIAFIRDLRDPKAMMLKLKNLRKLKTHAGNYLAVNYGILPTISDLKEIAEAFKKRQPYLDRNGWKTYNANHIVSSGSNGITVTLEQRIKLAIQDEDNGFVDLMNRVDSSGFAPTLENIWDLIPYSFVLDWFIDIGGFLERVDTRMRLARLDIKYATMSRKAIKTRNINFLPGTLYTGTLSLVQYSRWTKDHSPVPPLFFQNTPTVSNHWLEASALIIQRTK